MTRLAALIACLAAAVPAAACPFCTGQGQTLVGEARDAQMILFGELKNARRDPAEFGKGETDLHITKDGVIKDHTIRNGRKVITIPRYVPPDPKSPYKFLVFCEIYKGKIDPYRGIRVPGNSRLGAYLTGALKLNNATVAERLKYHLPFLNDNEREIRDDAYTEFANADYKDYRPVAERADPEEVATWLTDERTLPSRLGLFGSMLGHCGKAEHAQLLRRLLTNPSRKFSNGLDGMLAGYVLIDPEKGWRFLKSFLVDKSKPFLSRYAGLQAIRFLWQYRPDVVKKAELAAAVTDLARQDDISDLAIDDLRKWGHWKPTAEIIALYDAPTHKLSVIKRAVIRYALDTETKSPAVERFLKRVEAEKPAVVKEMRDLLRAERQGRDQK